MSHRGQRAQQRGRSDVERRGHQAGTGEEQAGGRAQPQARMIVSTPHARIRRTDGGVGDPADVAKARQQRRSRPKGPADPFAHIRVAYRCGVAGEQRPVGRPHSRGERKRSDTAKRRDALGTAQQPLERGLFPEGLFDHRLPRSRFARDPDGSDRTRSRGRRRRRVRRHTRIGRSAGTGVRSASRRRPTSRSSRTTPGVLSPARDLRATRSVHRRR